MPPRCGPPGRRQPRQSATPNFPHFCPHSAGFTGLVPCSPRRERPGSGCRRGELFPDSPIPQPVWRSGELGQLRPPVELGGTSLELLAPALPRVVDSHRRGRCLIGRGFGELRAHLFRLPRYAASYLLRFRWGLLRADRVLGADTGPRRAAGQPQWRDEANPQATAAERTRTAAMMIFMRTSTPGVAARSAERTESASG